MVIVYVYMKLVPTSFELIELDLSHGIITLLIASYILVNNEASRLMLVQSQLDEINIKKKENALTLSDNTESVQGMLFKRDSMVT